MAGETFADEQSSQGTSQPDREGILTADFGAKQIGRYALLRKLGQGGMGVVYAAYDDKLDRKVAVKLLRSRSPASQRRLIREAQAMARLSHPNVAQVYEFDEFDGQPYLIVEFVDGDTLRQWLLTPRSRAEILAAFLAAGRGLAAAHDAGLVHRDFKPDNVMVRRDGRILVMDFGLVHGEAEAEATRQGGPRSELARDLTQTGAVMGTPAYMAPEQFLGRATDARADQFSFCVALWEALHGARPFIADDFTVLSDAVTSGKLHDPGRGEVPAWLHAVLLRGLQIDPAARWPSMDALLDALGRDPTRRRRRALVWGVAASLAIAGGVAVVQATRAREAALSENRSTLEQRQAELEAKEHELAARRRDIDDATNVKRALRATMLAEEGRGLEALVLAIEAASGYGPQLDGAPQEVLQALFDVQGALIVGPTAELAVGQHVRDVVFSPTGEQVAVVTLDDKVSLWDLHGELLETPSVGQGSGSGVCALDFPANDAEDALGSLRAIRCDERGRVFDPEGALLFSPDAPEPRDQALWDYWSESTIALPTQLFTGWRRVALAPDGEHVLAIDSEEVTWLWGPQGRFIIDYPHSGEEPLIAAFDPSSDRFATRGSGGAVDVWGERREPLASLLNPRRRGRSDPPWCLSFSPFDSRVAVALQDRNLEVWDAQHQLLNTFEGHGAGLFTVAFSPDGQYLASGAQDTTVRLWNGDGTKHALLERHRTTVRSVAFSPSGRELATAGGDEEAIIWRFMGTMSAPHGGKWRTVSLATGHVATYGENVQTQLWSPEGDLLASFEPGTRCQFSADGARLLTYREGAESVVVLRSIEGNPIARLDTGTVESGMIKLSSDGSRIALGLRSGGVVLWSSSGERLATLAGARPVFSPDGTSIVTTVEGGSHVWDAYGRLLRQFESTTDFRFSPDGRHVVITFEEAGQLQTELRTVEGDLVTNLTGLVDPGDVGRVSFSPSGDHVAVVRRDAVQVWSSSGEMIVRISEPGIRSIGFLPDGERLTTSDKDGTVRLRTLGGELLSTFVGHETVVWELEFSPDGSALAAGGRDASTTLWRLDGRLLGTVNGHWPRFLADGSALQTHTGLWLMPPRALRRGCKIVAEYPTYHARVADFCDRLEGE